LALALGITDITAEVDSTAAAVTTAGPMDAGTLAATAEVTLVARLHPALFLEAGQPQVDSVEERQPVGSAEEVASAERAVAEASTEAAVVADS